jgi:RimJ/RimL family protein N-acetyltransferase
MVKKVLTKNKFLLLGKSIKLCEFTKFHINNEYIGWLNDPQVVKFSNQRFIHHDFGSCSAYHQSFKGSKNLFLAIHLKDNNKFIGTMTVYFSSSCMVADLGLMIGNTSYWGKGIGQEVWQIVMTYMLKIKKIPKVTGGTLSCNLGMINIMKKTGMQLDSERIKSELVNDRPINTIYFAKFRNE